MQSNRKIFSIGETLLDIVFKNNKPIDSIPGGSMLNSIVSCARSGLDSYYISEYSNDEVGGIIDAFLDENAVNTSFVNKSKESKTSLALAFLNKKNDASYQFYAEKRNVFLKFKKPVFSFKDILLFGSYYSLSDDSYNSVKEIVDLAKTSKATIIYDPNIRISKLKGDLWKLRLESNFLISDIVKASNEDIRAVYGNDDKQTVIELCNAFEIKLFILTRGRDSVQFFFKGKIYDYEVPEIEPVSTIGSGDSFNAGIIFALVENEFLDLDLLTESDLLKIAQKGIEYAQLVCMKTENYIDYPFF